MWTLCVEFFGDEVSNENIRNEIKEAKSILKAIREHQAQYQPEANRLYALADKIEKSLAEILKVFK